MKIRSESIEETAEIAARFLKETRSLLGEATVVGLYGDLGSGKTTFVQAAAKALGIKDTVTSPTFVIMKAYPIKTNGHKWPTSDGASKLRRFSRSSDQNASGLKDSSFKFFIHIDAYRIEKEEEMLHLGWEEIIKNSSSIIFVEWPDKIKGILPIEIKKIYFTFIDENTREIEVYE